MGRSREHHEDASAAGAGGGLFAPVCSIAPTKRRRFFWAVWWSGPPVRDPFRAPDASSGGARTEAEALEQAERAAGRSLALVASAWARAWTRVLVGLPPWPEREPRSEAPEPSPPRPVARAQRSAWVVLGLEPGASADAIKRAYRARALTTHPDRGGDPDAFREVHRAYERALAAAAKKPRPRRRA